MHVAVLCSTGTILVNYRCAEVVKSCVFISMRRMSAFYILFHGVLFVAIDNSCKPMHTLSSFRTTFHNEIMVTFSQSFHTVIGSRGCLVAPILSSLMVWSMGFLQNVLCSLWLIHLLERLALPKFHMSKYFVLGEWWPALAPNGPGTHRGQKVDVIVIYTVQHPVIVFCA